MALALLIIAALGVTDAGSARADAPEILPRDGRVRHLLGPGEVHSFAIPVSGGDFIQMLVLQPAGTRARLRDGEGAVLSSADCLDDEEIERRIGQLGDAIRITDLTAIVVSNEVGSGIVPMHPLTRRFRDLLGLANQMLARQADKVVVMQMGIPVVIKDALRDARIG